MDPEDSFTVRIGMFLLVLGGGALMLFIVSDIADQADFDYFFISMILIVVGYLMWRKKPPPPPAGRFEWFNKWNGERKKKREEKQKAKEKN